MRKSARVFVSVTKGVLRARAGARGHNAVVINSMIFMRPGACAGAQGTRRS